MSTFGSGQAPINIESLDISAGSGVVYTVPSGRYAKVYFIQRSGVRFDTGAFNSLMTSGRFASTSATALELVGYGSEFLMLDENDTLTLGAGPGDISAVIEEFTKVSG